MEEIDSELIRELLGDEAYKSFETMKKLQDILEESGYIQRTSEGCKLTAQGIKKIGEKALADIFAALKKEHFGRHQMQKIGQEGERTGGVRNYQYGDPFAIDLKETFLSALHRDARVPISISPTDFHVYEMESMSSASTVLLLDLSYSMIWSGSFLAAKKVAIALNNLIRTRYRKDVLYIVGFYAYAKEIKPDELPFISWDWWAPYTNIQEGLRISAKLLSNHKTSNKQIVLISDGEPTAHFENDGRLYFQYPPSPRTMSATLREVKRCTQKGITINTFMLDKNPYLIEFVNHMTRINKGRAFFTSPDDLGQYLMVDYLERKRKLIR